jgi:DNA-binding MurR/RpiR family transcriptional regulator
MPDTIDQSIEARIRARYDQLADSERPLADLILSFPGQVASYSATELAALAGVSKAAASRLVKKIGFDSYDDMRRIAREGQGWGSPQYLNSPTFEGRPFDDALQAHIACETENIRATLSTLRPSVSEIVAAMATATRIGCVGFRRSRIVADYLRWSLVQIRQNVSMLPPPGETISEALSEFDPTDLIVAVGLRRRIPLLAKALKAFHERGVRVLLIADSTAGSLAASATWFLPCEARSASPFDSDIAAISIAHFLSSSLASSLGNAARIRMQAVEQSLAALGELSD